MAAKKSGVNPILVGKTAPIPNNTKKIRFIEVGDPDF